MNSYEEKRQERIQRLNEAADRAEQKANASFEVATDMAKVIPFGQPILIGHHSERSDRNYREKIDGVYQKSFNEQSKADYLRKKARAAENNTAISSDDPDATDKLSEKLQRLENMQEMMKAVNSYYKKNGTCIGCSLITEEEAKSLDEQAKGERNREHKPFRSFQLTNNNQNIRSVRKRLEVLQQRDTSDYNDIEFNGGKVVFNKELNRIQFFFDEKPNDAIRTELKDWGFHFSPSNNNAWQRQINSNGMRAMRAVLKSLRENFLNGF